MKQNARNIAPIAQDYIDFLKKREERLVKELLDVRYEIRQAKWAKMKRRMVSGKVKERLAMSYRLT